MTTAIVGGGIAGLTAAWVLSSHGQEVTLFEKNRNGLEGQSFRLKHPNTDCRVDVPLRFVNHAQWPTMMRLYDLLDVELVEVDSSQSYSLLDGKVLLNFEFVGLFQQNPFTFLNPTINKLHREIFRLRRTGAGDLAVGIADQVTFAEYLASHNFFGDFLKRFLYPVLCTTVCTCSEHALDNYPARIVLDAMERITGSTGRQPHAMYKARHGISDIAARLLQFKPTVIRGADVRSVTDLGDEVEIHFHRADTLNGLHCERFDHVILATQANHAGRLLRDNGRAEPVINTTLEMLQCFEYESVDVVLHTDKKLMPANRRSWSAFNMISAPPSHPAARSMCSVWINKLDPSFESDEDVFQTIMPIVEPDPASIISSCQLQRPAVNQNSFRGWALWEQITRQPDRRIWFVGSYASPGVPLLETAVVSALKVAAAIGIKTPFDTPDLSLQQG